LRFDVLDDVRGERAAAIEALVDDDGLLVTRCPG